MNIFVLNIIALNISTLEYRPKYYYPDYYDMYSSNNTFLINHIEITVYN